MHPPFFNLLCAIIIYFENIRKQSFGCIFAKREFDPRNISRELVNRFVGENYVLLP
jgi:hypothetical protein